MNRWGARLLPSGVSEFLDRYARQARVAGIGPEGQARLARSHAAIVGVGSLGCLSAELLARAGVGRLTLIDRDLVEGSNLSRQTLFTEADAEAHAPKAEAGRRRLRAINGAVRVVAHTADLNAWNAERLLGFGPGSDTSGRADVLIDGTDTFSTRYLLNDVAVKHGTPLVYGGAVAGEGSAMVVRPGRGPCLRCLAPDPPAPGSFATCESAGIFGPAAALVAAWQASEAIKTLLGMEGAVSTRLLRFDLMSNGFQRIETGAMRDPSCPCCGQGRYAFLSADPEDAAFVCSTGSVQIVPSSSVTIGLSELADRLASHGTFTLTPHYVRGRLRDPDCVLTVFADARAIVKGTESIDRARSVYARYVGG